MDALTVLTVSGSRRATKSITVGTEGWIISGYDKATYFTVEEMPVDGIKALHTALAQLVAQPQKMVIRGALKPEKRGQRVQRMKHGNAGAFVEMPRRWAMLDFDKRDVPAWCDIHDDPEAAVEWMIYEYLPPEFHDVSCVWKLSSSAGAPGAGNVLSAHVWIWLDRPLSSEELREYFKANAPKKVDVSVCSTVQPHYTAAPIFTNSRDPLPRRMGLMERERDEVCLPPIDFAELKVTAKAAGAGWGLLQDAVGFEEKLALVGDGDGLCGFHEPIRDAVMAYVRRARVTMVDSEALKRRIRQQIAAAPKGPGRDVSGYMSDYYLDASIEGAIRRKNSSLIATDEQRIERHTLEQAGRLIGQAVDEFANSFEDSLDLFDSKTAPVRAINVDVGGGKTRTTLETLARRVDPQRTRVHYYVPTHMTAAEVAADYPGEARIYRGRTEWRGNKRIARVAEDGTPMCMPDRQEVADRFEDAGLSVWEHVCQTCPHLGSCGWSRQQQDKRPGMIVMPVNYAFEPMAKRAAIQVFDERMAEAAMRDAHVTVGSLAMQPNVPMRQGRGIDHDATADLIAARQKLLAALDEGGRTVSLQALRDAGIDAGTAKRAQAIEHQRADAIAAALSPTMTPDALDAAIQAFPHGDARRHAQLWRMIGEQIDMPDRDRVYGVRRRVVTTRDGDPEDRILMRWTAEVEGSDIPTLIIDATLDEAITRRFFPALGEVDRIAIEMPHAEIVQVADRAVSMRQLAPRKSDTPDEQRKKAGRIEGVARALEVLAAGEEEIGFFSYKATVEAARLPDNVVAGNFNGTRGSNRWQNVSRAVIAGRTLPSEDDVELQAEAIWWKDADVSIQCGQKYGDALAQFEMANGMYEPTERVAHPDPLVERVRWQCCEAELIQTIGRMRGTRRTADNPVLIVLATNVPLPLRVSRLIDYEALIPSRFAVMAARGVIFETGKEASEAYPDLWPTAQSLRDALRGIHSVESLYDYIFIQRSHAVEFRFQPPGARQKYRRARYIPALVADPRQWLEQHLSAPMARVLVEEPDPHTPSVMHDGGHDLDQGRPSGYEPETLPAGLLTDALCEQARRLQRACGWSQDEFAQQLGLARPTLANALGGRYALGQEAMARLDWMLKNPPPTLQASLF